MIPQYCITAWRQQTKWIDDFQIEQNLILSRVSVNLYSLPSIYKIFAFRGGTALNKLYIQGGARYSEDIDLVQIQPEPIGKSLDNIRSVLDPWLGKPLRKLTERSAKLLYLICGFS
jgi:predicted nucleotidyltransferase component of viral defense system